MLTRGEARRGECSQPREGVDAVTLARDRDNDAVKTIERYQPGILPVETKRSPRGDERRRRSDEFVSSVGSSFFG